MSLNIFPPSCKYHSSLFIHGLNNVDNSPFLEAFERNVLKAVLQYTTNDRLLERFSTFSTEELEELAKACSEPLRAISCAWGGVDSELIGKYLETEPPIYSPRILQLVGDECVEAPKPPTPGELLDRFIKLLGIKFSLSNIRRDSQTNGEEEDRIYDCLMRQNYSCAITGRELEYDDVDEASEFFPSKLISDNSEKGVNVWKFMALFLGEDKYKILVKEVTSETRGVHTIANRIVINISLDWPFKRGRMGFLPTGDSGEDYIDVQLTWLGSREGSYCNMTCLPPDVRYQYPPLGILNAFRNMRPKENIRFFTTDVEAYPQPSAVLMTLHTVIWRLLAAAGMAETFEQVNSRFRELHKTAEEMEESLKRNTELDHTNEVPSIHTQKEGHEPPKKRTRWS